MYREHFGFTESPFNVTSDPRFFYSNRSYQEAFIGLRWGIKLRRGLIVMTGEAGACSLPGRQKRYFAGNSPKSVS
jgi:type II secretory pathway predicted ATPase ExeA